MCSAGPARLKDRTRRTKLEIPFGHAFDRREVSSSKGAMLTIAQGRCKDAHCRTVPDTVADRGAAWPRGTHSVGMTLTSDTGASRSVGREFGRATETRGFLLRRLGIGLCEFIKFAGR